MLKYYLLVFISNLFYACGNHSEIKTNPEGETIKERIAPPEGFEWVLEKEGSFGEFLQNLKLQKEGSKVLNYSQHPIINQYAHVAIIDYDIGNKDLQQCADAVIRLRAEYLFKQKRYDEIKFQFTNGDVFRWNDYKKGVRPKLINSNKVVFEQVANYDESYKSFRNYLDIIFMYAGSISLNRETNEVKENNKISTGDILITPGSPGHVVIIVGKAKNLNHETVFLLAQGYTPAQSIHVLNNPNNKKKNPWYILDLNKSPTATARYLFKKTNIRSF
jgi:hypothetical protein